MIRWNRVAAVISVSVIVAGGLATQLPRLLAQTATTAPAKPVAKINLPAELPIATGFTTQEAFPGISFRSPLCIATPPGETDRVFIVGKNGEIEVVSHLATKPEKHMFLDVAHMLQDRGDSLATAVEWGVLGIAFHPDFAHNGYVFVTYDFSTVDGPRRRSFDRLSRFTVSKDNPNELDPKSEVTLITQLDLASNHNGGDIHFGPDGYLYYGMGDEGDANDSYDNARWIDKDFFAAIYRLDVDMKPGSLMPNPHTQNSTKYPSAVNPAGYRIPADNPFIGATSHHNLPIADAKKVRTEIYACGMRNPWRFSFDEPTGRLFVADVGQDRWEEIDIVRKGGDYGWSYYEALHNGPRFATMPEGVKCDEPIYEYGHNGTGNFTGKSISGGFIYRGKMTELYGAYIFGDYVSKRIWALREKDGKWTPSLLASGTSNVAFGLDPSNGDVLLADNQGNRVMRMVRAGVSGPNPPALLSQTGAFKDLKTLAPADGMMAYQPNVTFWSDYAVKQRWFTVANPTDTIGFSRDGNWTFPTGMVWVKNFEMEMKRGDASSRRRLETRFIMKTATGSYGITYKWRDDQSDADLVSEEGRDEPLTIQVDGQPHTQVWHYPSRSECMVCHTHVGGEALGFNTWQLNGNGGGTVNQIQKLAAAGYLSGAVGNTTELPAYVDIHDASKPIEARVRSYIGANCVQCHQPGGVVQGTWDARPNVPLATANIINGTLVSSRGDTEMRFVVPADPLHSMALRRLTVAGAPRMPPLATNELDPDGIALMTQWIKEMQPVNSKARGPGGP